MSYSLIGNKNPKFKLFWLVGIIEEEEEIEKAAKIALDLEKKRNNEELSHHMK